jgi:hypothetical protein
MSLALSIDPEGSISTYAQLKEHIAEKMDRDDLAAQIPNFIRMAEFWLADAITHPFGEVTSLVSTTAGVETVALPVGFSQLRSAHLVADPLCILDPVSPATMRERWTTGSGQPQSYAILNGLMLIGPVPDAAYSISLTYLSDLVPLSDVNQTNWLLTRRADIYVYASLLQAEAHIVNDQRLPVWKTALDEAVAMFNAAGNRYRASASPLRLRNPVCV